MCLFACVVCALCIALNRLVHTSQQLASTDKAARNKIQLAGCSDAAVAMLRQGLILTGQLC